LVARAAALKGEWDKQRDKERDLPPEAKSARPPAFDWNRAPWSVDGLTSLMEAELTQQQQQQQQQQVDSPPGDTGSTAGAKSPASKDWLLYTVRLLAGLPAESLAKLQAATKKVAVYRAIRSQRFLEFTEEDLRAREAKQLEIWRKLTARHGKVSCIISWSIGGGLDVDRGGRVGDGDVG